MFAQLLSLILTVFLFLPTLPAEFVKEVAGLKGSDSFILGSDQKAQNITTLESYKKRLTDLRKQEQETTAQRKKEKQTTQEYITKLNAQSKRGKLSDQEAELFTLLNKKYLLLTDVQQEQENIISLLEKMIEY